jgi:hypothetical protein
MDRQTRVKIEDDFERRNGLLVPTEFGNFIIPKGAKILKGGGPQVKADWGEDVRLVAGVSVLSPDGEVKFDREWESKSFTRWFSRVMQSLLDFTNPGLTDFQGNSFNVPFAGGGGGVRGIPNLTQNTSPGFGLNGGTENTGGMLAIGNGAYGGVDSGFTNLKNLLFFQTAVYDGITTQEDTAALAFYMTTGITLATIGGTTIQEIGLFARFWPFFNNPHLVLMAYDEVNPGVVAAYGDVIAPKYSMAFAA